MQKKIAIVYGNCQAEIFSAVLANDPGISAQYRVLYRRSFDHPFEAETELSVEDVGACDVLFEQHDRVHFPLRDHLPARCSIVSFPSLDTVLFWPFNCPNPFDKFDPPLFPWGHFPYGDRIIVEGIQNDTQPDDLLSYYLAGWDVYAPDLERLLKIELARLAARDRGCHVKIAEYFLANYQGERLCWTVNHPTPKYLGELIRRIITIGVHAEPGLGAFSDLEMEKKFATDYPLAGISVPIHPRLVKKYGLAWYDAEMELHQFSGAPPVSYREYFREMIDWSRQVRKEQQTVGVSTGGSSP